jgi:hypothetical protein
MAPPSFSRLLLISLALAVGVRGARLVSVGRPAFSPPRARAAAAAHSPTLVALGRQGRVAVEADDEAALRLKRRYINLTGFPFPLGPIFERATTVRELHRGRVWLFEQEQSLGLGVGSTISANARMVVVRLRSGELWVLNPIAPTVELVEQLRAIGGRVAHVVLGSTQYEHKILVPPFMRARAADRPQLWIVPEQWSFPFDFPPEMLGLAGARSLREDMPTERAPPWATELPFALLRPRSRLGLGYAAVEAAFVHRQTRTLLLTDGLVRVPPEAPAVLDRENLRALGSAGNLVSAVAARTNWRGRGAEIRAADAADAQRGFTPAQAEKRGWQRNAVLALYFGPSAEAISQPELAFRALEGRWLVGPVCATLIYSSDGVREAVRTWVDRICKLGGFDTIVPAHFAVARGTPSDVRRAFAPLLAGSPQTPYRAEDVRLLADLSAVLRRIGVI